jgi:RNA polymerase sigma factor (sigma-70 family)
MKKEQNSEKDLQLVEAHLSGDKKAFDLIFKRHKKGLYFFLLRKIKNPVIAEDLVMESFVKVFENLDKFNNQGSAFSTWLYRVAHNHMLDYIRREKKKGDITCSFDDLSTESDEGHTEFQPKDTNKNPEEDMIKNERIVFARNLIDSIKSDFNREVIDMRYIQELSYEEIAENMNKSVGTIKSAIFRAKEEMQRKVVERGS